MENYKGNSTKSGIYQIRNIQNNKLYIGSAAVLGWRKSQHFKSLSENRHDNSKFQNAYNKYGKDSFIFEVIEFCERIKLVEKEQYWLNFLLKASEQNSYFNDKGYNILRIAGSSIGFKHSEETKKLLSESQKGKKISEETKQLLLKYSIGRIVSEETKQKLRDSHIGKKSSEETKNKLKIFNSIPIELFKNGEFVKEFQNAKECADYLNISQNYIYYLQKRNKKYKNEYEFKKIKKERK